MSMCTALAVRQPLTVGRVHPLNLSTHAGPGGGIGLHFSVRRAQSGILAQARAKKASEEDPAKVHADALLRREAELWDRHTQMMDSMLAGARQNYETLMAAHSQQQAQHAAERAAWELREERLREENAELRAQVMYALARIAATGEGRISSGGGNAGIVRDADVMDGEAAAAELPSRAQHAPRAAPASESHFSPAFDSQPQPTPQPATAGAAASPSQVAPSWAAELRAAMAAPNEIDVLREDVDFAAVSAQQAAAATSSAVASTAAAPATPATPPPAAAEQSQEEQPEQPRGPPPALCQGADDLFWVNQLHTALCDLGYFPGEEDIDDLFFGDSTQSAVMTMQACEGLTETGIVDAATWAVLLGPEMKLAQSRDLTADQFSSPVPGVTTPARQDSAAPTSKPFAELFTAASEETATLGPGGEVRSASSRVTLQETGVYSDGRVVEDSLTVSQSVAPGAAPGEVKVENTALRLHRENAAAEKLTKWPVLMDGDGGREVHALQILLEEAGYAVGEDDCQWWQFGDTTINALKTFQACSGLPESGVADPGTWELLMGPDASPAKIYNIVSGRSDDEDLADDGGGTRVWLMGEQRWEDRSRLDKG